MPILTLIFSNSAKLFTKLNSENESIFTVPPLERKSLVKSSCLKGPLKIL